MVHPQPGYSKLHPRYVRMKRMLLLRVLTLALAGSVRTTTAASSRSCGRQFLSRNTRSSNSGSSINSSGSSHAGSGVLGCESKASHARDGSKGAASWTKLLPPSVEGAMRTRGGEDSHGTKRALFHRAGIGVNVNRQAVPAAEALSRYETAPTPLSSLSHSRGVPPRSCHPRGISEHTRGVF